MRLGIFGGTFNPIHFGHLRTAEEVRYKLDLDRVIFIPSGNPPLKSLDLTDASHRYAMARLATKSNRYFDVSDIELKQPDKSYTVNTLQKLCELYPRDELYFILGLDAFLDMPNWWQPERLIRMVEFIVVPRPGFDTADIAKSPYMEDSNELLVTSNESPPPQPPLVKGGSEGGYSSLVTRHSLLSLKLKGGRNATLVPVTPLGISSTDIRALVKERKSIGYLLPEAVEEYISAHGLYR